MRNQPITCTACEREFKRGERFITESLQHERVGRRGAVKVENAEIVAAYHPGCAPSKGRA